MNKPVLLDICCGAGGITRGFQEAGFYVVGVDNQPQPRYCGDEFILDDCLHFLDTQDLSRYDAIAASVPCQGYTLLNATGKERHRKLIPAMRERLQHIGKPYVIENVMGAVSSLPGSMMLCGTMFGLKVERHRLFESNILLFAHGPCQHADGCIGVYGHTIWDSSKRGTTRKDGRVRPAVVSFETGCIAMGIDWMSRKELPQAIPPAYGLHIGGFLYDYVMQASEVAV